MDRSQTERTQNFQTAYTSTQCGLSMNLPNINLTAIPHNAIHPSTRNPLGSYVNPIHHTSHIRKIKCFTTQTSHLPNTHTITQYVYPQVIHPEPVSPPSTQSNRRKSRNGWRAQFRNQIRSFWILCVALRIKH
eukprot:814331_1